MPNCTPRKGLEMCEAQPKHAVFSWHTPSSCMLLQCRHTQAAMLCCYAQRLYYLHQGLRGAGHAHVCGPSQYPLQPCGKLHAKVG